MQLFLNLTWTEFLAFWGASLSTFLGIFEFYKLLTGGPKIIFSIHTDMVTPDYPTSGAKNSMHSVRASSLEKISKGDSRDDSARFIWFKIRNIGDQPTTLTGIYGRFYENHFDYIFRNHKKLNVRKENINGEALPFKLDIGGEWTGHISQVVFLRGMFQKGQTFFGCKPYL